MKFGFSFHLINLRQEINGQEYKFQSKGGRVLLLGLIVGFLCKYMKWFDINAWAIIGLSVGACIIWDLITMGLFMLKMSSKLKAAVKELENSGSSTSKKPEEDFPQYMPQQEQKNDPDRILNSDLCENWINIGSAYIINRAAGNALVTVRKNAEELVLACKDVESFYLFHTTMKNNPGLEGMFYGES